MKKTLLPLMLAAMLFPLLAGAQTVDPNAGTDNYLMANLPDASTVLSNGMVTESRQPFETATTLSVTDPVGDVLSPSGTPSTLRETWGDIAGVTWTKDDAQQAWVVAITCADAIPAKPDVQAQFTIYANTDGVAANNDTPEGVHGSMNAQWNVKYSDKYGWGVDFQWYNPKAAFWGTNKTTKAQPFIKGNVVALAIPYAELPADWSPRWRALVALQSGGNIEVDVAPGIGFPPAKSTTTTATTTAISKNEWPVPVAIAVVVAIGLIGLLGPMAWRKMRKPKV